ncbi:MAG TPA: Arc family DNA-binding protein [Ktedonobacterales bacterium]|jgi:hypothetical protein
MSKEQTIKTTAYFPVEIWEQLRELAKAHRRSMNSELVWAIQQYLEGQKRKRTDA